MAKWELDGTGCIICDGKPITEGWLELKAHIVALLNAAEPGGMLHRAHALAQRNAIPGECQPHVQEIAALIGGAGQCASSPSAIKDPRDVWCIASLGELREVDPCVMHGHQRPMLHGDPNTCIRCGKKLHPVEQT